MSIIDTLITDRSAADLSSIRSLLAIPFNRWTAEQKEQFNLAAMKGAYNYTDLNRVNAAMDALKAELESYGYAAPRYRKVEIQHNEEGGGGDTVVRDPYLWYENDIPTASDMEAYLSNVSAIRNVLSLLPTSPMVPDDMDGLTVDDANAIEQILVDVETVILRVVNGFARSASFMFVSGNRPIPTAESDHGRTWEELDKMQTTWENWQGATWYLLLYGNLKAEGVVE